MAESIESSSSNLSPWRPGQSGNPAGSSKRRRARDAARRISGLAPAIRAALDQQAPEELLANLSAEQRAALDGDETLAEYLAARLVSMAASATNPAQLLEAMRLIGSIDSKIVDETAAFGVPWQEIFELLPPFARQVVIASLDAHENGRDQMAEVCIVLGEFLKDEQDERVYRTSLGGIDLRRMPEKQLRVLIDELDEEHRDLLDRVETKLRETVVRLKIEKEDF